MIRCYLWTLTFRLLLLPQHFLPPTYLVEVTWSFDCPRALLTRFIWPLRCLYSGSWRVLPYAVDVTPLCALTVNLSP